MAHAKKCPICLRDYTGHPAISRVDNKTPICPDCGTREAMAYMGVSQEETERILAVIRNYAEIGNLKY